MDIFDKARGPIEPDNLFSSDQHAQQMIKSDEMVDMCVRDKDVLQALNFPRR